MNIQYKAAISDNYTSTSTFEFFTFSEVDTDPQTKPSPDRPVGLSLTPKATLSQDSIDILLAITPKRARRFIDAILMHGFVTTDDLRQQGYEHPPRSAQDVKDFGIPLIATPIKTSNGNSTAYTFGDFATARSEFSGRLRVSKPFRQEMLEYYGCREAFSGELIVSRVLQIDHRVPYQIGGETSPRTVHDYMLLDASSQRTKSISCEACPNFQTRDPTTCRTCFWAFPEKFDHIATSPKRRLVIDFVTPSEVDLYTQLGGDKQRKLKDILAEAFSE